MCPATDNMRKKRNTVNVDEILDIIRHMPSDARHITITGGEPFLIGNRIFEIFKAFKEKCHNTSFLLLTNGRALSYEPFIRKFYETAPTKIIIGIHLHFLGNTSLGGL
jgi:organic radical activating enzyme